jgi:hypothetical protein
MCRGGLRGSPATIGGGALISSGTFMPAISAASGPSLGSISSARRLCGAVRRVKGDTSPPAGCCMGTFVYIWELVENSRPNAESLPARQSNAPIWELLDFIG